MFVHEAMTRNPKKCFAAQRASDAARAMWDFDIGCVAVIDEKQRPLGMITDRDICIAANTRNLAPSQFTVADAMPRELFTCEESDPLSTAERIMQERQVRRLPVIDDDGKLIAILSINDMALAARRFALSEAKHKLQGDVERRLEAICRHRASPVGAQL